MELTVVVALGSVVVLIASCIMTGFVSERERHSNNWAHFAGELFVGVLTVTAGVIVTGAGVGGITPQLHLGQFMFAFGLPLLGIRKRWPVIAGTIIAITGVSLCIETIL